MLLKALSKNKSVNAICLGTQEYLPKFLLRNTHYLATKKESQIHYRELKKQIKAVAAFYRETRVKLEADGTFSSYEFHNPNIPTGKFEDTDIPKTLQLGMAVCLSTVILQTLIFSSNTTLEQKKEMSNTVASFLETESALYDAQNLTKPGFIESTCDLIESQVTAYCDASSTDVSSDEEGS